MQGVVLHIVDFFIANLEAGVAFSLHFWNFLRIYV